MDCRASLRFAVRLLAVTLFPAVASAGLSMDPKFSDDGFALFNFASNLDAARDLAVADNGDLVLVGLSRQGSFDYLAAVRLGEDGTVLKGFGDGSSLTMLPGGTPQPFGGADGRAVAIQGDDQKIVVAGTWNDNTGGGYQILVVRLMPDGSPDPDFGDEGVVLLSFAEVAGAVAEAVAIDPDGRILVAGGASTRGFVLRLTPKGEVDNSFAGDGLYSVENPIGGVLTLKTVQPVAGGKVVAAGGGDDFFVVRLDDSGSPDPSFSGDGVAQVNVGTYKIGDFTINTYEDTYACAVLPDGRLLVGGSTAAQVGARAALVRLTSTGSLDASFGDAGVLRLPGAPSQSVVYDIAPREGGDFVVAGLNIPPTQFSSNGTSVEQLPGPFPPQAVTALVTLDDGRVVGAGEQNISGADYQFVAMRFDAGDLPEPDCEACGEVNGDCRITTADALAALRMAVGQIAADAQADMDGSGTVSAGDALLILKLAVGSGAPTDACKD